GLSGALVGCTDTTDPGMDPSVTNEQTNEPTDDSTSMGITEDEASDIAVEAYGGTVEDVEEGDHEGEATWTVTLTGAEDGDMEVDVSQETGQIVAVDG